MIESYPYFSLFIPCSRFIACSFENSHHGMGYRGGKGKRGRGRGRGRGRPQRGESDSSDASSSDDDGYGMYISLPMMICGGMYLRFTTP